MQAYENKTLHMLHETIDDESVCVYLLRYITVKDKILPFPNYNVRKCNLL
jgi:hypothetical protein